MSIGTGIAIFFLIWWLTLFTVLPWGVRSQHEGGEIAPGTDPGAPSTPRLGRKLIWTTLIACVVFSGCYLLYDRRLITFETIDQLLNLLP